MSQRTKSLKKFRELDAAASTKEEAELRSSIWKMKVQKGTGQTTDPLKIGESRRELARLLTVRREREGKAS
jgi:ribosomal protein L29